ncbi:phosphoglucosamine mutase [soil metagenome]
MTTAMKLSTSAKLFGTDGIRGEAGQFPLDKATIPAIGASFAQIMKRMLGREPRFVIGRDTRESGDWIENAFSAGATRGGAVCRSAGVMTTPGVAFVTDKFDFDAGIVISASHNPFHDNGIKIFARGGKKVDESIEKAIEVDIASFRANGKDNGSVPFTAALSADPGLGAAYIEHLAGSFSDLDLSGVRIITDCANGAASLLAPLLFRELGAEVTALNDAPDGRNINLNCGSLHLEQLQEAVTDQAADMGIAFDGDADRSLFVDHTGAIVDGDATLWVLAQMMADSGKLANHKVVATVMSNIGLEAALKTRDIELIRSNVGDKHVLESLLNTGSELGGEQSGHIIIPERGLAGDGMMTALYVLESMKERVARLADLVEGFERFPQILVNVRVGEKKPFAEVPEIELAVGDTEEKLGDSGRLLLRYSGTENLARVMIEGKDQAEINELAGDLAQVISDSLG